MRGLPHSRALLPLIPPTPFSHKGKRGSLGFLKPRMRKEMQGLPKKPTPVGGSLPPGIQLLERFDRHPPADDGLALFFR
jgi:hypothetical protein